MKNVFLILFIFISLSCINSAKNIEEIFIKEDSTQISRYYLELVNTSISIDNISLSTTEDTSIFLSAISYLDSAIQFDPNNKTARQMKIDYLIRLGNINSAINELEIHLGKYSFDPEANTLMGMLLEYSCNERNPKLYYKRAFNAYSEGDDKYNINYFMAYYLLYGNPNIDSFINEIDIEDSLTISIFLEEINSHNREEFIRSFFTD